MFYDTGDLRMKDAIASTLVGNRRAILAALVVVLLAVSAGAVLVEEDVSVGEFEIGTEEEEALAFVEDNFPTGSENRTAVQIVVRSENVLEKETLLRTLELQREIRTNESVAGTLPDRRPTAGIANVVATAAIRSEHPELTDPTLDRQIAALSAMNGSQIDAILGELLRGGPRSTDALVFLPDSYDGADRRDDTRPVAGTGGDAPAADGRDAGTANATMVVVFQSVAGQQTMGQADPAVVDAQLTVQDLAAQQFGDDDTAVVGNGIVTHEMQQSMSDTWIILGPLALVLVLVILVVAYRDLLDVLLSLLGIVLVQTWTFGMLGWVGVAFNPVLIAVPVLLIGLSIDYCLHVFMRYRESRARSGAGIADAMTAGLAGVGAALVWVTVTTGIGFLSNMASPVQPIREIGVIASAGIVGALVIFGLFIPLLKVELDALLERYGFDRSVPPIGNGGSWISRSLSVGSTAARKAPVVVVVATLLLTAGAAVAATDVSTSWGPEDNIVDGAPGWTEHLPAELQPGEYSVREDMRFANAHFVSHDSQVEVLVEGSVADAETLRRLGRARERAAAKDTVVTLGNGDARTEDPLTVMERVAASNPSFAETFRAADTTGDGVPDENVAAVYDELFATAPDEAASVVYRVDGEDEAIRLAVSVDPEADGVATTEQLRDVAAVLDGPDRTATATGDPIVEQLVQHHLLATLLTSLFVTIGAVLAVLVLVYRFVHGSATLGAVTLLPVVFTVAWIVATMYALGYPLNVLNAIIASLTVGIGIDYSIHVSERFREELDASGDVHEALRTTVRGTGGALLGSAATTAVGFGVLGFAIHPMLQQFGLLTAVMIVYAFLGAVLVLPSMLVLWARYLRPGATGTAQRVSDTSQQESPGD
ncbi:MAG: MMPL family transporter [Halovenus sp.]